LKARIYLSELEEIARKAEDLDQIGWNPRANLLMKKLQGLGNPAVQPTITEMFNKDNDWKFRFVCIDLLHGIEELSEEEGNKIVQSYVEMLWNEGEEGILRGRAAHALERIGVTSEAHTMTEEKAGIKLPQHPWPKLLPSNIKEDIVDTLIVLSLDDGTSNSVRCQSIRALCTYYDFADSIINSIAPLLSSSNEEIRTTVVNTLGGIGMMAGRDPIGKILVIELQKGERGLTYDQVLFWIKGLKIKESIPLLLESLETGKYCSKAKAAKILGEMKVEEAENELINLLGEGNFDEKCRAAEALGDIGSKKAVEPLIKVLGTNLSVTNRAAEALGKIGDPKAIKPLMEIFKEGKKYHLGATESIPMALMALGATEAIPLIEKRYEEIKKEYPNSRVWEWINKDLQKLKGGEKVEYYGEEK
jgi:HEAT repeat protein